MSESLKAKWRAQMPSKPIDSCGRLDMDTHLCDEATVGRVTSDRVRYVYFSDGQECIVLGEWCDFVAFRAADYDTIVSDNERLRAEIARLTAEVERHRMTPEERNAVERAAEGYCEVVANIKLAVHGGDGRDKYAFTDDVLTDLENYMKRTA